MRDLRQHRVPLPWPLRAHRARRAGAPHGVRQRHQQAHPGDLQDLRQDSAPHSQELDAYRQQAQRTSTEFTPTLKEEIAKEILTKAKKVKLCPHCGKQQYQIELTKPTIFHEITEEGGATRLLPGAISERLERITNEDLELLDYNPKVARPEWFVLQVLPVPPLTVRPSITLESGIRSEDDLTHKIVDILRVNQRVREAKESGTPHLIVQDLVDLLHYHVTTYFDNEVSGIPQAHHRSGRPLKTLSQRLKGKEGRFRGSLSGKRVDFSSRTVISPDPSASTSARSGSRSR